jgi:hypothetical protein
LSDTQGEENLMKAVAMQPVSVGICAGPTLMFYAGGVLDKVRFVRVKRMQVWV